MVPPTVHASSAGRHLVSLENVPLRQAKADLKILETGEREWKSRVGRALERAIELAHLSQKEAAGLMGRDQGQVGRWISGAENAQLATIMAVDELRDPFVIALAGLSASIEVVTEIRVRRSA